MLGLMRPHFAGQENLRFVGRGLPNRFFSVAGVFLAPVTSGQCKHWGRLFDLILLKTSLEVSSLILS